MSELRIALARFDDVLRQMDGILGEASSLDQHLATGKLDLLGPTQQLRAELGAAMPDQLATTLDYYRPLLREQQVTAGEASRARAQLARLGAVARGVDELGGVDTVIAQGGLDAIDGAAAIVQRHLFLDARAQLVAAKTIVGEAPGGLIVTKGARAGHLRRVQARLEAPLASMGDAGVLPARHRPDMSRWLGYDVIKDNHQMALEDVSRYIHAAEHATPDTLGAPALEFYEANLVSTAARTKAADLAMAGLPSAPPLRSLPQEAVITNAAAALDRHLVSADMLVRRIGESHFASAEYKAAIKGAESNLRRAIDDAEILQELLLDAPGRAAETAYLVRDWGNYLLSNAGTWSPREADGIAMLPNTVSSLRALREEVTRVVNDPDLLHAGAEAADEARELLQRRGTLDVGALRQLLEGDAPRSAHRAIAAHVAQYKPLAADAPPASSVEEARRLLDEADLISESVRTVAARHLGREELGLDDPQVLEATRQVIARRRAALGVRDRVPERLGSEVKAKASELTKGVDAPDELYPPRVSSLEYFDRTAAAYRAELLKVTERAAVDGGLRAIPPSARPAQARDALAGWIMRELDSLPGVAAKAPAEQFVDNTARRVALVSDLLEASVPRSGGSADPGVVARAGSEIASIGDLWRYPDDTALTIAGARRTLEDGRQAVAEAVTAYRQDENLVHRLRKAVSELRAWSALPDGTLPHTSSDRIAVAARRSDALRTSAGQEVVDNARSGGRDITKWIDDVDTRLADIDSVLGGAAPRAERSAVDDALAAVRANLEHRTELYKSYRDYEWKLDRDALEHARQRIAELDGAIARVHADVRAADAEQLAW